MNLVPKRFYFDDFFDNFLEVSDAGDMKCDIYEKDNKYHIEMDFPGFEKGDIKLSINNKYLTISAEKGMKEEDEDKTYIRRERCYNKYERSFYVGNIDEKDVEAKFEKGMLTVVVPKEKKEEKQKFIEIK